MRKTSLHHTPYLKNHIYMIVIYAINVQNDKYPGIFLSFFQNFESLGGGGEVKVQKMFQNEKILSVALFISGTIHHMTVIYNTHM